MKNSIIISIFTASLLLVTPVFSQTADPVAAVVAAINASNTDDDNQIITQAVRDNPALAIQIANAIFDTLGLQAGDPKIGDIITAVNNGLASVSGTSWIIQSPNTGDQQRNGNVERVSPFALTNVAPVPDNSVR